MEYCHTQKSPLDDLLFVVAAAGAIAAWSLRLEGVPLVVLLLAFTVFMSVAGLSFGSMTVQDEGERLAIRYGPLPLFRKQIPYDRITSVTRDQSSIIDGLGIHYVPGRGWTYNLWGTDCVELLVDGKVIRVGTDDVENLTKFVESRIKRGHSFAAESSLKQEVAE